MFEDFKAIRAAKRHLDHDMLPYDAKLTERERRGMELLAKKRRFSIGRAHSLTIRLVSEHNPSYWQTTSWG